MAMFGGVGTSSPNFSAGEQEAVVISRARANDRGDCTVVFCLNKNGAGNPFRLRNQCDRYIWSNEELRNNGIKDGSIITYQSCNAVCLYSGNTGDRVVSVVSSSFWHYRLIFI